MAEDADAALWEEVERMAQAAGAADAQIADGYPSSETIEKWKRLFGSVTRGRITDEHRALIRDAEEAAGYDREAYEHRQQLSELFGSNGTTLPVKGQEGGVMFGFRLGGLLGSAEKVKEVAELEELPKVKDGMRKRGPVKFCMVDMETKGKLKSWLKQQALLRR